MGFVSLVHNKNRPLPKDYYHENATGVQLYKEGSNRIEEWHKLVDN